jgi:hypothetical protein
LAVAAGLVAASAIGGATGLATGWLSIGQDFEGRLPFASPVIGAQALALVIRVPFWGARMVCDLSPHQHRCRLVGIRRRLGGLVIVELAFVREVTFLQPFFKLVGAGFMLAGRSAMPGSAPDSEDVS